MQLQESGEMYLETIHVLSQKGAPVRSLDVANAMGFSKPSVSRAMATLKERGYVMVNEKGHLSLTEKGLKVAVKIYERHVVLTEFLTRLGVDKTTAEEDACRIEHVISDASFEMVKKQMKGSIS